MYRPSPLDVGLTKQNKWWAILASWLYGSAVKVRGVIWSLGIRTPRDLPGVVISVGNLEVGGTGKSPVVISLSKALEERGKSPVVLTRGYGVGLKASDFIILLNGKKIGASRPGLPIPDEAAMQSHELPSVPIVIGSNRFKAAQNWLKSFQRHSQSSEKLCWILDDGFQHWALRRRLDIVLLYGGDGQRKEGDAHLLPRGRLREPPSALKRASVVLVMRPGTGAARDFMMDFMTSWARTAARNPNLPVYPVQVVPKPIGESFGDFIGTEGGDVGIHHKVMDNIGGHHFDPHHHCPALLVCGIARPQVFFDDFLKLYRNQVETPIAATLAVGDHQPIDQKHLESLLNLRALGAIPSEKPRSIVTTAKDLARDPEVFRSVARSQNILVFVMTIEIENAPNLWERVLEPL